MKKILFIHHNTISVGAGLSALHIIASISQERYNVVVCMPAGAGDLGDKLEKMGVKVRKEFHYSCTYTHVNGYHYNLLSISHLHNVYELLKSREVVQRVIQEEHPDIVMVNSMTLFWIGHLAQKAGAKTICFHRESYCHGMLGMRTNYIKYRLNRDFDKIVFLSEYDMKQTGNNYGKYIKITDKVDIKLYDKLDKAVIRKELQLPETDKLILFAGGMSKLKGIDIILKALNAMQTDAKLVLLQYNGPTLLASGIKGWRQKFRRWRNKDTEYWAEQYIKEHNLENRVILRGQTDEVQKYFVACDMVVFPSQEAHQARPIFEAGIAGRPIAVSDFENTREYLDAENGWCVKYDDVNAWAAVCDKVLQGGECVDRKIELNYNRAIKNNNIDDQKRDINNLMSML